MLLGGKSLRSIADRYGDYRKKNQEKDEPPRDEAKEETDQRPSGPVG